MGIPTSSNSVASRRLQVTRLRTARLRAAWWSLGLLLSTVAGTGCSLDGLLNSDKLPPDVTDPAITKTSAGALAAYQGTLVLFQRVFGGNAAVSGNNNNNVVAATGVFSDELYDNSINAIVTPTGLDVRILSSTDGKASNDIVYSQLQKVRGQAGQAIGLLNAYLPDDSTHAGEVYALAGYAEVLLADFFCSGIPLSTLDYNGDYTYKPGSTTEEVYAHAGAMFDTALTLAGTNDTIAQLARVGQARALLARGQYAAAAAVAAAVPADYLYAVSYAAVTNADGSTSMSFARTVDGTLSGDWSVSVADREGQRGLDYVTSGDPRTALTAGGGGATAYLHPNQYAPDGSGAIVLASGTEARLIEAEAALYANPDDLQWLDQLNALRTNSTQDGGGTYNPGTGGVAGLAPLADPGTDSARISLVFRERAFWLFLTGHRQGDLRRLLRDPRYKHYWPTQDRVYPIGQYRGGIYQYGDAVVAPIPPAERVSNPLFTGCSSLGA